MKTQMRVQKILMLVTLVVSALVFVYALSFLTGGLADVYRYIDSENGTDFINCAKFVSTSQSFVKVLVAFGIVMIVLVAAMYLMACHSRRKYYITNYIAIGLFVVFALVVAIYMVIMVASIMNLYQNGIRWNSGEGETLMRTVEIYQYDEAGNVVLDPVTNLPKILRYEYPMVATNYADQAMYYPDYPLDPKQTYNFILGFIMFVVVIVDVVCVVLCTVWKVLLMKGEKKLLAGGAPAAEKVENEIVTEEAQTADIVVDDAVGDNPVKEDEQL